MGSSYSGYKGQSIGRILYFLNKYCGLDVAEQAVLRDDMVTYYGKVIARFTWSKEFGEADVPDFIFCGDNAEYYTDNQILKRTEAIEDSFRNITKIQDLSDDAVKVFSITEPAGYRSASIFYQGYHDFKKTGDNARLRLWLGKVPDGYHYKEVLVFESYRQYYWDADLKSWIKNSSVIKA